MTTIYLDNWVIAPTPFPADITPPTPGCTVKVSNGRERFFVMLESITDTGVCTGYVSNELICNSEYNLGDTVQFRKENIFLIHTPEFRNYRAAQYSAVRDYLISTGMTAEEILDLMSQPQIRGDTNTPVFAQVIKTMFDMGMTSDDVIDFIKTADQNANDH
jgi:hypothetical protein